MPQVSKKIADGEHSPSAANARQHFVVPPELDGLRLDIVLAQLLVTSRSQIKTLIDEQRVWVDGRVKKAGYLVRTGEELGLLPLPAEPITVTPQEIPLDILYEDEYIAAINKPTGMVVHPAPGQWEGTVVNALLYRWGWGDQQEKSIAYRPGIVHRLDKDTSGVLVIAKTQLTLERLSHAFKERRVHKRYLAVVHGCLRTKSGTIELPIGRHPLDRKKMAVRTQGGRAAVSRYQVRAETQAVSLLHLFPETGRTHQLRVHLAAIGHPIVGDHVYGGGVQRKSTEPLVRAFPRQALHAEQLEFLHPFTGRPLRIRAPYPADLLSLLEIFRHSTKDLTNTLLPVDGEKRINYH
jgi:23S rRNA pseudouridine1911/1915/1917 synthase